MSPAVAIMEIEAAIIFPSIKVVEKSLCEIDILTDPALCITPVLPICIVLVTINKISVSLAALIVPLIISDALTKFSGTLPETFSIHNGVMQ